MLRKMLIGLAVAGALAFVAPSVSAQTVCGERAEFLKYLGTKHNEAPTAMGMTRSGQLIEVLSSRKGSFTIIVTNPQGRSCMVAAGDAWEAVKTVALGPQT